LNPRRLFQKTEVLEQPHLLPAKWEKVKNLTRQGKDKGYNSAV
jgi:hypothetical protein